MILVLERLFFPLKRLLSICPHSVIAVKVSIAEHEKISVVQIVQPSNQGLGDPGEELPLPVLCAHTGLDVLIVGVVLTLEETLEWSRLTSYKNSCC